MTNTSPSTSGLSEFYAGCASPCFDLLKDAGCAALAKSNGTSHALMLLTVSQCKSYMNVYRAHGT